MIKEILSDKDLVNTAINQLYRLVSGPLMLLFIPLYLNQEEQGYWYTFGSVAALAVFADLGFSNIILQFAAHEFAFLKFKKDGTIYGDEVHLHKLADFFRFSVKWLYKVTLIVFPIIVIGGYIFINQKNNENINWVLPWFIYSISSALVFVNSSLLSFFEGCNSVAIIQNIRFKISVFTSLTVLIGLFFKLKLFALAISLLISALVGSFFIYINYKQFIIQMWKLSEVKFYSWKKEFIALIWRYAISWSCGYLVFQPFVPLYFKYFGAIEAGKVGFSLTLGNAIFSISNIILNSKLTLLNILITRRVWHEVDKLLKDIFLYSSIIFMIVSIGFMSIDFLCYDNFYIFKRFLPPIIMLQLFITWMFQLLSGIFIAYLRAHNKEPMLYIFIIHAICVFISTVFIITNLSKKFLFVGLAVSYIFLFLSSIYFFYLQRKSDLNS